MGNVQVRLPDDMEEKLKDLAEELHASRSEAIRRALDEGLKAIRLDRALQRYARGEVSLARAAHDAGVSIYVMAKEASEAGIPYFRYSIEEVERDAEVVGEFLARRRELGGEDGDRDDHEEPADG